MINNWHWNKDHMLCSSIIQLKKLMERNVEAEQYLPTIGIFSLTTIKQLTTIKFFL